MTWLNGSFIHRFHSVAKRLILFLLVLGAAAGAYAYFSRPPSTLVLTGVITTNDIVVSPQIGGRLSQMLVEEGEAVKRDQLLAVIAPDELRAESAYATHMDEAEKLCDRIAVVDHGELKALDSPMKLKASVPGKNMLEASFSHLPPGWAASLEQLPQVEAVTGHDHVFRLASSNGPATTLALTKMAAMRGVTVSSLAVQSTTLDDVFVHYTGRGLRDALQDASATDSPFMIRRQ